MGKAKTKDDDIVQGPVRPLFFNIKTFKHWKIEKPKHRTYLLTDEEENESFKISLGINTSLEVQMDIVYCEKVVIYRGTLSEKMRVFWFKLGDKLFRDTNNQHDEFRQKALDNYDWGWK